MKVLLTNDDGIAAPGLAALVDALSAAGTDAVVVAPDRNQSGVARATTYRTPVEVKDAGLRSKIPHFECNGSPVDCVRVALLSSLAGDTELVISGVNHGPNLGDDALISGTVGAAAEAALLGVPAVALSDQVDPGNLHVLDPSNPGRPDFGRSARVGVELADSILAAPAPDRAMLNVNVPTGESGGTPVITRLGRRFYVRGGTEPGPDFERFSLMTYGEPGSPAPRFEEDEDTDFGAVMRGLTSVTPISFDWGTRGSRGASVSWAAGIIQRMGSVPGEDG